MKRSNSDPTINRKKETELEKNMFQLAKNTSDARYSHLFARMQALKLMNWGLLAVIVLLLLVVFTGIKNPSIIPYLIEVNENGSVVNYGRILEYENYQIEDVMITYYLKNFIKNIRIIDNDSVVIKRNWQSAYHFSTDKCAKILNRIYNEIRPLEKMKFAFVEIEFISLLSKSEEAREIEWIETEYDHHGTAISRKRYRSLLTFVLEKTLISENNPSGFFIDSLVLGEVEQ